MNPADTITTIEGYPADLLAGFICEFNVIRRHVATYPPHHPIIDSSALRVVSLLEQLIADEVTSMVDQRGREALLGVLSGLNERHGMTLVQITHYNNEAAIADRVVNLSESLDNTTMVDRAAALVCKACSIAVSTASVSRSGTPNSLKTCSHSSGVSNDNS